MEKRLLLYLLISFILAAANLEESLAAKTRHYKFEVAYIYWSPDCEERMTIGINGRFPGPTIRAKAGDTIVVELKNGFYHGHYGMQRAAGLYGSLIVDSADGEKEPFHYDGEHNLLLSDWWHESVHAQMLGLSSIPFRCTRCREKEQQVVAAFVTDSHRQSLLSLDLAPNYKSQAIKLGYGQKNDKTIERKWTTSNFMQIAPY